MNLVKIFPTALMLSSTLFTIGCAEVSLTPNTNVPVNESTTAVTEPETTTNAPVADVAVTETIIVHSVVPNATTATPITLQVDPATLTVDSYGYRNYVDVATGIVYVETPETLGEFYLADADFQGGLTEEEYEVMDAPIQAAIEEANKIYGTGE